MVEIRGSFSSIEEWTTWRDRLGGVKPLREAILRDIRRLGYREPITEIRRRPREIVIQENNLHESIRSYELNSRKRALILQFYIELLARGWHGRRDLRILGAEGLTRLALILRGRYPFFHGAEYLPTEKDRRQFFPIPHMDLHEIEFPDNSFDVFISGDVFEHLPDLNKALTEICRVLKPGGMLISSFPFNVNRVETRLKASISERCELVHHEPPEYHGNPANPEARSLVFQLPGWDIVPQLTSLGCEEAHFSMVASSRFGVVSDHTLGPFVLIATKEGGETTRPKRPHNVLAIKALPDKLCVLIALPRSGTTLITSVFSVHSTCEAVYEPWNATKDATPPASTIEAIAAHERLGDLSGKLLFVKETAANQSYIASLRALIDSAPFPVEKYMLLALRKPEHIFLSEIERRAEWWNDDIAVNRASFESWAAKSRVSLRMMIRFGLATDGIAVVLEEFAARPADILADLGSRMDFLVERQQLEYEKHVELRRVRGDMNVSKAPAPIDLSRAMFRQQKTQTINGFLADSPQKQWFEAFQAFYDLAVERGGVMPISSLTTELRDVLLVAD
jgi:SAM-dependent methyltransferase